MISIDNVLTPERTFCDFEADSNKRLLEVVAVYMNQAVKTVPTQTIYEALIERERLGSTAIGSGVALPHARIEGLEEPVAVFARLKNSVDFASEDNQPIDLVFALAVPKNSEKQYLNILAQLAERFRDPKLLSSLRRCESSHDLYKKLVEANQRHKTQISRTSGYTNS
jgi:PTS system nitrogen regulatory IIA component